MRKHSDCNDAALWRRKQLLLINFLICLRSVSVSSLWMPLKRTPESSTRRCTTVWWHEWIVVSIFFVLCDHIAINRDHVIDQWCNWHFLIFTAASLQSHSCISHAVNSAHAMSLLRAWTLIPSSGVDLSSLRLNSVMKSRRNPLLTWTVNVI